MNISGIKVKFRDGTIKEVIAHDCHLHIMVDGKEKLYNYEIAFKSGGLEAVDPDIQNNIMKD